MKYCKNCGNQLFDEAVMCPKCGSMQQEKTAPAKNTVSAVVQSENPVWGLLAVIFGAFGSLGLVFGIIGLCAYRDEKDPNHKKNKLLSTIGLILGALQLIVFIIICISLLY